MNSDMYDKNIIKIFNVGKSKIALTVFFLILFIAVICACIAMLVLWYPKVSIGLIVLMIGMIPLTIISAIVLIVCANCHIVLFNDRVMFKCSKHYLNLTTPLYALPKIRRYFKMTLASSLQSGDYILFDEIEGVYNRQFWDRRGPKFIVFDLKDKSKRYMRVNTFSNFQIMKTINAIIMLSGNSIKDLREEMGSYNILS